MNKISQIFNKNTTCKLFLGVISLFALSNANAVTIKKVIANDTQIMYNLTFVQGNPACGQVLVDGTNPADPNYNISIGAYQTVLIDYDSGTDSAGNECLTGSLQFQDITNNATASPVSWPIDWLNNSDVKLDGSNDIKATANQVTVSFVANSDSGTDNDDGAIFICYTGDDGMQARNCPGND